MGKIHDSGIIPNMTVLSIDDAQRARYDRSALMVSEQRVSLETKKVVRGIAQSGSAPALGAGCRGFESLYPDHSACSSTG